MKIIIFVQAPRDILYALSLYKSNKNRGEVVFYVLNVENNYESIKRSIQSEARVVFIENRPLRRIQNILIEKFRLANIYKNEFQNINNGIVYFFSNYFDFKTFYFVSRLASNNKIIFFDHYQQNRPTAKQLSFFSHARLLAIKVITGCSFLQLSPDNILIFDYAKLGIKKTFDKIDNCYIEEYIQRVDIADKSVLLLDSNDENSNKYVDYKPILISVIELLLSHGYIIYVKPHPRMGLSSCILNFPVEILDSTIPLELLSTSKFSWVIGNTTAALAGCNPELRAISIMMLIGYSDEKSRLEGRKYLENLSSDIKFPASLEELKEELTYN